MLTNTKQDHQKDQLIQRKSNSKKFVLDKNKTLGSFSFFMFWMLHLGLRRIFQLICIKTCCKVICEPEKQPEHSQYPVIIRSHLSSVFSTAPVREPPSVAVVGTGISETTWFIDEEAPSRLVWVVFSESPHNHGPYKKPQNEELRDSNKDNSLHHESNYRW